MKLISHRGNINGPIPETENKPEYIDNTIRLGYDVEIDIWVINKDLFLGHDEPQYKINLDWIDIRAHKLWVHCKNIEALETIYLFKDKININYFWHQKDTISLTSKGYIWAYPGKQPIKESIAVIPELYSDNISQCLGICSDYIQNYN